MCMGHTRTYISFTFHPIKSSNISFPTPYTHSSKHELVISLLLAARATFETWSPASYSHGLSPAGFAGSLSVEEEGSPPYADVTHDYAVHADTLGMDVHTAEKHKKHLERKRRKLFILPHRHLSLALPKCHILAVWNTYHPNISPLNRVYSAFVLCVSSRTQNQPTNLLWQDVIRKTHWKNRRPNLSANPSPRIRPSQGFPSLSLPSLSFSFETTNNALLCDILCFISFTLNDIVLRLDLVGMCVCLSLPRVSCTVGRFLITPGCFPTTYIYVSRPALQSSVA